MAKVHQTYYAPTPEQRAEIKAEAARLRGRTRAMRNLRDTMSGFNRVNVGAQQATHAAQTVADEFRSLGWSDSAAGELAALHADIHFPEGGAL